MDDLCAKTEDNTYKNKDLTAGLFIGCCMHKVCYGFHLMLEPEGRKDVMKVLYERIPQEVLDGMTILFDFACQAGVYCTRREPTMFAQTKFLVDRFHGMTHKCSEFWKLGNYPGFAQMQSTASERFNAFLAPFNVMCAYMKQETGITLAQLPTFFQ